MKVLIELEITGDFEEDLDDDNIEHMLDRVICEGAESYYLNGNYVIKEIIER